jgi:hypothetical protein
MRKTFLKDATTLLVLDFQKNEKKILGRMLTGIVTKDETNRFPTGQRVITSTIESQYQFEYSTKSGNSYITNDDPENFDISFVEFVVMRDRLCSPAEILELRKALKKSDDRTMH